MKNRLFEETLNDIDDAAERAILLDAWDRLGALDDVEPSPSMVRRFERTVEAAGALSARPVSPLRRLMPLAAAFVIGISIGALFLRLPSRVGTPPSELDRLSRIVSSALESPAPAPRRLEAIGMLADLEAAPRSRELLIGVVANDPSIGVRLSALDVLDSFAWREDLDEPLVDLVGETDSTLVRIRLIELLVDHGVETALPVVEALSQDSTIDELVRETAQWASRRLQDRRQA